AGVEDDEEAPGYEGAPIIAGGSSSMLGSGDLANSATSLSSHGSFSSDHSNSSLLQRIAPPLLETVAEESKQRDPSDAEPAMDMVSFYIPEQLKGTESAGPGVRQQSSLRQGLRPTAIRTLPAFAVVNNSGSLMDVEGRTSVDATALHAQHEHRDSTARASSSRAPTVIGPDGTPPEARGVRLLEAMAKRANKSGKAPLKLRSKSRDP
ncbi:unnamed protein product, partial [Symbiodinium sp. KB8]